MNQMHQKREIRAKDEGDEGVEGVRPEPRIPRARRWSSQWSQPALPWVLRWWAPPSFA